MRSSTYWSVFGSQFQQISVCVDVCVYGLPLMECVLMRWVSDQRGNERHQGVYQQTVMTLH